MKTAYAADDTAAPERRAKPRSYAVLRLGTINGSWSSALAVSALGKAAGAVGLDIEGGYRPALFIPGRPPQPLYTDGPGEATGINIRTEIVGWFRQGSFTQAFRWWREQLATLSSLGGGSSHAAAINNRSEIVGWSEAAPGAAHAVYWWGERLIDLGTWGGYAAQATALNERGDIVGFREVLVDGVGVRQGVRLMRGRRPQLLPTLPGYESVVPASINNRGDIGGYMYPANNYLFGRVAFIYADGKYKLFPTQSGNPSVGTSLNVHRDLVGYIFDGNADPRDRGIAWLDGGKQSVGLVALPEALQAGWYALGGANAINDVGVIVGDGQYRVPPGRRSSEAYMLIPRY
ncbi:hypothetical protein [Azohydromonas caseinilytica]|uniref:Uncharacterized protein n=1 Tax=Azohydromonas caseinilytica TaxID=2728836 RepID=A0A848FCN4_9BURK|nr:hypothetical protein [Azohydromonas caseinilytica]NML17088.1 hypothetical protein [Azohydromonas caseinilytica]